MSRVLEQFKTISNMEFTINQAKSNNMIGSFIIFETWSTNKIVLDIERGWKMELCPSFIILNPMVKFICHSKLQFRRYWRYSYHYQN